MDSYQPHALARTRQLEHQAILDLREKYKWTDETGRRAVIPISGGDIELIIDISELVRVASASGPEIVLSLVSREYTQLGLAWLRHLEQSSRVSHVVVCADVESYDTLKGHGATVVRATLPELQSTEERNFAGFTDKGVLISSLKFVCCQRLIDLGLLTVFSDIDAFWIRDPMPQIRSTQGDILFQAVYLFPEQLVHAWGFAACCGFVVFRPTACSSRFLEMCNRQLMDTPDDQIAMNLAIAEAGVTWRYGEPRAVSLRAGASPPQRLARGLGGTDSVYGISESISGTSERDGATLVALPQSTFRRHQILDIPLDRALVFHPNSPKEESAKLEVFRRHGVEC